MTDHDALKSDPFLDPSSWLARDSEFEKLCEFIRPANKTVLFDALAQAGISGVEVTFDGYGDSGQIEEVTAMADDKDVELPAVSVEIARVQWGSSDIVRTIHPLTHAIEQVAYDFLSVSHGGWENNEGAYGDFLFDVASRTITLNYNERIESSEYTKHVF